MHNYHFLSLRLTDASLQPSNANTPVTPRMNKLLDEYKKK